MIDGGGVITITGDAGGDDLGADGALTSTTDGITDVAQLLNGEYRLDDNSRIFNNTVYQADTTLGGLTLTGGRTTADGEDANDTSQAGGAVLSPLAELTIKDSTISGNSTAGLKSLGGGIGTDAMLAVTNSIILGNKALQSGSDELFEYGDAGGDTIITVSGANIIGSNSEAFDTDEPINGDGAAINTSAAVVFAEISDNNGVQAGVLAENGGDIQTIALKAGGLNPALDAATIAGSDARGQARGADLSGVNNGGTSDPGAFELQFGEDNLAPVFTSDTDISVGEGLSAGLIALPVTATDVTDVVFSIGGGPDASRVSINSTTGVLSFTTEPDFENPTDDGDDNTFNVLVRAIDALGSSSFTTLKSPSLM